MPTTITHRRTNIVTLATGETVAAHCKPDDIALVEEKGGWWVHFVGEDGASDTYDEPYPTYNQALWAAKAAAEFSSSL
jgi:homoserine acetyltransferase